MCRKRRSFFSLAEEGGSSFAEETAPMRERLLKEFSDIVKGGPCFTRETAWVMEENGLEAVSHEYNDREYDGSGKALIQVEDR